MQRRHASLATTSAILATALFIPAAVLQYRAFFHDDAFIALRYARNFLNGNGLVWNVGERVEGFTSLLHVLLLSTFASLGLDLILAAQLLGLVALGGIAASLLLAGVQLHRAEQHHPVILATTLTLGLCNLPLVIWSLGGLETVPFTLMVTLCLWGTAQALRAPPRCGWWLGAGFAITALLRPDGLLFAAVAAGFAFGRRGYGALVRESCIALLLILAPIALWRHAYYGDFVPNTFYAKSGFTPLGALIGMHYIVSLALSPPFLLAAAVGAVWLAAHRRCADRRMAYLATSIGAYLAYVVWIGGDHMPAHRFLVPILPSAALLLNLACQALYRAGLRQLPAFLASTAPLLVFAPLAHPTEEVFRARRMDPAAFYGVLVGDYIDKHWPRDALIAANAAGALPYYAEHARFIDMLGLNDRHIARRAVLERDLPWQHVPGHLKGDGQYVLDRRPDYIILGPASGTTPACPMFLTDLELGRLPEFSQQYRLVRLAIPIDHVPGHESYNKLAGGVLDFFFYERVDADALVRR